MIPSKYIEELKNAPDDAADFIGSFVEVSRFQTTKKLSLLTGDRCSKESTRQ